MHELWGLFLRTIFVYMFIFLMMRLMGKREVGKLSVFDLVVSFMIADISAISLEGLDRPLVLGLLPIVTIVGLQILVSFISLKNDHIRHWLDGTPSIIINKGQIEKETMAKARYNLDDLIMQLRENDIADIRDVEFAILETSGKLSVFPKIEKHAVLREDLFPDEKQKPYRLPVSVIIEGVIKERELSKINRDIAWLKKEIQKQGYQDESEIFYASVDQTGELYIDPQQ